MSIGCYHRGCCTGLLLFNSGHYVFDHCLTNEHIFDDDGNIQLWSVKLISLWLYEVLLTNECDYCCTRLSNFLWRIVYFILLRNFTWVLLNRHSITNAYLVKWAADIKAINSNHHRLIIFKIKELATSSVSYDMKSTVCSLDRWPDFALRMSMPKCIATSFQIKLYYVKLSYSVRYTFIAIHVCRCIYLTVLC